MTTLDERPAQQQDDTTAAERTTVDLLLAWDQTRDRSQQTELGWSEVGGCRRRAGYRLAGVEATDPGGSLPAIMGTAIHEAAAKARAAHARPGTLIEYEVTFAGILGHLDWYEDPELGDLKTTTQYLLDRIIVSGPPIEHLWQANGYAAGLIREGRRVHRIVIEYVARDTGNSRRWVGTPDPQMVRAALEWVAFVRDLPLDMLPRDYKPTSEHCKSCPFRTRCWDGALPGRDPRSVILVESPDDADIARHYALQLEQARADKAAAEKLEDEAKGVLDALRPNEHGRSDVVDVGLGESGLRWTVTYPRRPDTARIAADYEAAGMQVPVIRNPQVTLRIVPLPKTEDTIGGAS